MIVPGRFASKETSSLAPGPGGTVAGGAMRIQLTSPPCALSQLVQAGAALVHSPTHSHTLPAIASAPPTATQPLRVPVSPANSALVAHLLAEPSAAPGVG